MKEKQYYGIIKKIFIIIMFYKFHFKERMKNYRELLYGFFIAGER